MHFAYKIFILPLQYSFGTPNVDEWRNFQNFALSASNTNLMLHNQIRWNSRVKFVDNFSPMDYMKNPFIHPNYHL
jgi:hypothetical protein